MRVRSARSLIGIFSLSRTKAKAVSASQHSAVCSQCGLDPTRAVFCLTSCLWPSWTGSKGAVTERRVSGFRTSQFHLCFFVNDLDHHRAQGCLLKTGYANVNLCCPSHLSSNTQNSGRLTLKFVIFFSNFYSQF